MQPVGALVLVVDDEETIVLLCRLILELEGYAVEAAATGCEAIAHARRARPDLIVMDVMLPMKDGRACLHELKTDPELASIPVLMFSGSGDEAVGTDLTEEGAAGFLAKPFQPEEFVSAVRAALGRRVPGRFATWRRVPQVRAVS